MTDHPPLPHLALALRDAGYEPQSYSALYRRVASGLVPHIVWESGRWRWRLNDLEAIALELGLTRRSTAA